MKKAMIIMLISLCILFGLVFAYKLFGRFMMQYYIKKSLSSLIYVSAKKVGKASWQPELFSTGNVRAVLGVEVTTELAGMVDKIYFTPGQIVKKGDLLVLLDIKPDTAQLHVLEAAAELAKINYNRDKAQLAVKAVSQAQVDTDSANLKSADAQVEQQQAIIEQKTIRAPFSGRLGISQINPGQFLNPGNNVVMLQTWDPIYVDFYIPQNNLAAIKEGQSVSVTVDTFPQKIFKGKITTINPGLDASVRNVQVEATIANPNALLTPGMFANVIIDAGTKKPYLTIPQTAVSFNPYGEIVFILNATKNKDPHDKPIYEAKQRFVKTGSKRGDQVTILEGLKEGDLIVISGQLKLRNGSLVVINNTIEPLNEANPHPIDE